MSSARVSSSTKRVRLVCIYSPVRCSASRSDASLSAVCGLQRTARGMDAVLDTLDSSSRTTSCQPTISALASYRLLAAFRQSCRGFATAARTHQREQGDSLFLPPLDTWTAEAVTDPLVRTTARVAAAGVHRLPPRYPSLPAVRFNLSQRTLWLGALSNLASLCASETRRRRTGVLQKRFKRAKEAGKIIR